MSRSEFEAEPPQQIANGDKIVRQTSAFVSAHLERHVATQGSRPGTEQCGSGWDSFAALLSNCTARATCPPQRAQVCLRSRRTSLPTTSASMRRAIATAEDRTSQPHACWLPPPVRDGLMNWQTNAAAQALANALHACGASSLPALAQVHHAALLGAHVATGLPVYLVQAPWCTKSAVQADRFRTNSSRNR